MFLLLASMAFTVLFLALAIVTLVLALIEKLRARGWRVKRPWGLWSLAAIVVAGACAVFPYVVPVSRAATVWMDEYPWAILPWPLVLFWLLLRALQWSYARRTAEEDRARERAQ